MDEVVGDKEAFDADDLGNLKYMHQVSMPSLHESNPFYLLAFYRQVINIFMQFLEVVPYNF